MKKRRIVIASVLKPVDDTRMFEKMGVTLGDSGQYEVFIIGYPTRNIPAYANINFLPLTSFPRLSVARLLAPFKILRILHQVNPQILIVNTHELLIVAVLNRILFGTKIVYDIRENYYRNLLYAESFPLLLRPFLAGWVRLKEKVSSPLFHHFFLAENGYQKEMSFFGNRATLIENKAKVPANLSRTAIPGKLRLLFSGTLAESTGVFQAISLAKKLHGLNEGVQLTLIGYCAKPETLRRIHHEINGFAFIQLHGGNYLVPHPEVIKAIYASDFGIVCYPPSRHTENTVPTKLYEYLACQLPILLQNHRPWVELASRYRVCIAIDVPTADPHLILQQMSAFAVLKNEEAVSGKAGLPAVAVSAKTGVPAVAVSAKAGVTWESEAGKLLGALDNIIV
jgi:glycosyltransferase involved in cell wall biosynthesis